MNDSKTYICKYCGKICKNKNSLAQHEIRCKENPNKIDLGYLTNRDYSQVNFNPSNQFIKAKQLGLSIPKMSDETMKQNKKSQMYGKEETIQKRQKKKYLKQCNKLLKINLIHIMV